MNHKTSIQATEIAENTEVKRVFGCFCIHLMGETVGPATPCFFSVFSVFSVANYFF